MSRRKQPKPQQLHADDLSLHTHAEDASVSSDRPPAADRCAHVCSRCCAEFGVSSDLEQHQRRCTADPPVLIVNEDEALLSGSNTFPASLPVSPAGGPGETLHNSQMENMDTSQQSPASGNCNHSIRGTDTVLCTSGFPESSVQPGCSADQEGYSWMKSNVTIESLESTKVAVAQLSQLMHSDSKPAISSVLQQLLALQIQQIHQLQLIDQIRHQVLLFASHQAEIPETLVICTKDLSSSKSTSQLKALGAHLSQQLTAAAGTAKCLSAQSADISDFKHFTAAEQLNQSPPYSKDVLSSSESSQEFSKLMTTTVSKDMGCVNFLSPNKMSSLMVSNNCFITKTSENSHLPQPSSNSEHTALNSVPNISDIVEDLDALAALVQQRKCKNLKCSAPTLSPKESLFKLKCRFCTKVFGSDTALLTHLRSHTGQRPYKCNICGSRFSTQGNLKVHFQRHQLKYPHIKTNPYLAPEYLDFGMSLSPEEAAARWLDRSSSPTTMTSASLEQSKSTDLFSLIKKEDNCISVPIPLPQDDPLFVDFVNPTKMSDSVETRQERTINLEGEAVKPSFNVVSKMMTPKSEESVSVIPNTFTLPSSTSFSGFLSFKHSDNPKLQLPSVTTDKRVSDPNECLICHRILSCPSALRMHLRTHTGERPYQCKLCGRAFTTKGNLKTHQTVHRDTVPLRVQHSCPICHRKFTSAAVLQQHVHMHMEAHFASADLTDQKYSVHYNGGFWEKKTLNQILSDNNGGFCDNQLPRFKSLSIHLSPTPFGKNLIDADKKTSNHGPYGELQLKWIKTERPEGSNEECSQTNNQQTSTFPMSDSSASEQSLSPDGQTSAYLKTLNFDEPFQTWLDSTTLMLSASAAAPTDLKLFNHTVDSPSLIHNLREKEFLKNTYCDICGKNFACQSALGIHYRSHTKERPFICITCNRGFSTKGNLKQHMLTHEMRDFPPHLFERSNPNQAPNHNGFMVSVGSQAVKTEMTSYLNSSFRNDSDLCGHSQSSPVCAVASPRRTPKQHHCETCGKSFSSSSALQIHERTHTGERPFACAVCGRAFTTKGNLKVHMGTHMWRSAPSRRGHRLSVDRSSQEGGTRPETSHKNPALVSCSRESVYPRNQLV